MAVSGRIGVLHLSSTSGPGGAEMIVRRLAASLDRSRFRSIVCLFRPDWLYDSCQEAGLPAHVIKMTGALDFNWARNFARLIRQEEIAVIHTHEFTANAYGSLMGRVLGVPVVATVHGKNYYSDELKRRMAYRYVSRSANMIAVSEDLKRFLVERVGIVPSRVRVIYNGVDVASVPQADRVDNAWRELELAHWDHVIGTVGSLYPVKGHIHLIRALPAILKDFPKTLLLLAGRDDLDRELKAEVARLKLEQHVRFLGMRNDVPVLLSTMDVFVLPSLSEGLSMALLEAMAASLPVVATRVGGNPEVVVEGETGLLIPPEDPAAIGDAVGKMLRNRSAALEMGRRGRRHVEERFSFKKVVESYQQCYEKALGRFVMS